MKELLWDLQTQIFKIKEPIWNGGRRCVGLNEAKIQKHNEIEIMYKDKSDEPIYPGKFYISGDDAEKYPAVPLKKAPYISVRWIPIKELEPCKRVRNPQREQTWEELIAELDALADKVIKEKLS